MAEQPGAARVSQGPAPCPSPKTRCGKCRRRRPQHRRRGDCLSLPHNSYCTFTLTNRTIHDDNPKRCGITFAPSLARHSLRPASRDPSAQIDPLAERERCRVEYANTRICDTETWEASAHSPAKSDLDVRYALVCCETKQACSSASRWGSATTDRIERQARLR